MRIIRPDKDLSTYLRILVNRFANQSFWHLPPSNKGLCLLCRANFERSSNAASAMLCSACWQDLPWNTEACASCAVPIEQGLVECASCLKDNHHYHHIACPLRYEFPADVIIKNYKYRSMRYYFPLLKDIINASLLANTDLLERLDALIAVPQDPRRAKERPYHVATKIAKSVSKLSGLPLLTDSLIKTKSSPAQAKLAKSQRLRNLRSCFELRGEIPERLLLIDDVVTTGATVETLAKLLQDHGAKHVEVWALARTPVPTY